MKTFDHLLTYFTPINYDLFLHLNKPAREFGGTVNLTGIAHAETIRLHAQSLDIKSVRVDNKPATFDYDGNILTINASGQQIRVDFSGKMSETALHGLYICKYRYHNQNCELMATQFEANHASELFPCIDEPAAKATFKVKIQTAEPVVLFNTPGKLVKNVWEFSCTPVMSTYLLAIVAGDLQRVTKKTKRGVDVSVYATPAQKSANLVYALDTAAKLIDFYEDYFQTPYPLAKSDQVALPDFAVGAMENWGLITYRETGLICNDQSSQDDKEYTAIVLAHELAHQWFGNLVTMQWWNDLWLNESFASFMEHLAVDKLFPQYKIWQDFESTTVPAALHRDAIAGVQTVRQDVNDPNEIDTLFDSAIVYAKGERLLKMLFDHIGESAFRSGLKQYFQALRYKNATAENLWQYLSAAAHIDVAALMNPWLNQPGYPLIELRQKDDHIILTQQRYFASGEAGDGSIWPIPLFSQPHLPIDLLKDEQATLELPQDSVIELNHQDSAHFITKYDDRSFTKVTMNYAHLTDTSKVKLLRETIMLAKSDHYSFAKVLGLIENNDHGYDHYVLSELAAVCTTITRVFGIDTPERAAWLKHYQKITAPIWHKLKNSANSPQLDQQKSYLVALQLALASELDDAARFAKDCYVKQSLTNMPTDYRASICAWAVKNYGAFNALLSTYRTTNDVTLKPDLAAALVSTKDAEEGNILRASCLDLSIIRAQDILYFISGLCANLHQKQATWQWIKQNWQWLNDLFKGDIMLADFIKVASRSLSTNEELIDFKQFFAASRNDPALSRAISMGELEIANNIRWQERVRKQLSELL